MEFLPLLANQGGSLLAAQDLGQLRRFLIPDSLLKATVVGLSGDKAVLNISGEKVLAQAPQVPLVLGQVLEVQVKQEGNTLQLKILSSNLSNEALQNDPELVANLLQSAGLPDTAETRDLMNALASTALPLDPNTLKDASKLLSAKPTPAELKAFALLELENLPAEPEIFKPLVAFFESQGTKGIPSDLSKTSPGLDSSLQMETPDPKEVGTLLPPLAQTLLDSTEAKLGGVIDGLNKIENLLSKLQTVPNEELANGSQTLAQSSPFAQGKTVAQTALSSFMDQVDAFVAKASSALVEKHPELSAQANSRPATSSDPKQAEGAVPKSNPEKELGLLNSLREAVRDLQKNLSEAQNDPWSKLQRQTTPSAQTTQHTSSSANALPPNVSQFIESHRLGNSILSRQDMPLVSVPIPLTLNGKNWVGYLHIYAEPDQKNFKKNMEEGTFALKFTVQTKNLGPVEANLKVQKKVVDGIFQLQGGEEKKFLEQNKQELLKRLESLPFEVRSIEARIGGTEEQEGGWDPTRLPGMLDIKV